MLQNGRGRVIVLVLLRGYRILPCPTLGFSPPRFRLQKPSEACACCAGQTLGHGHPVNRLQAKSKAVALLASTCAQREKRVLSICNHKGL